MKCSNCNNELYFHRSKYLDTSLENKLITCIQWICPLCKNENKEYFPKF